jgi:hypothetical protein
MDARRPLRANERILLEHMLEGSWSGAKELRAQLTVAEYDGAYFEGSMSFDLFVPDHVPLAPFAGKPGGSVWATVYESGEPTGQLAVWVLGHKLNALEYSWYTEEMPTVLPSLDQLDAPTNVTKRE